MAKVAVVAAAGTTTDAGTDAAALLSARVTVTPPVGAGPERVTFPVPALPPTMDAVSDWTADRAAGVSVSVAVLLAPAWLAVIVTAVLAVTTEVVRVNVLLAAPAATSTEAGATAAALLLARVTVTPPVGAAVARLTVP